VEAEATGELGGGGEASPALGDEGGAQEEGRLRGEAEQDFVEEVVLFQRIRRSWRRRGGTEAAAGGSCHPQPPIDWEMEDLGFLSFRKSQIPKAFVRLKIFFF
jgi:hypothetical protein